MSARDDYPDPASSTDSEAMYDEIDRLRRQVEFMEILSDGGKIEVNGIPWREAFERFNALVSDPV